MNEKTQNITRLREQLDTKLTPFIEKWQTRFYERLSSYGERPQEEIITSAFKDTTEEFGGIATQIEMEVKNMLGITQQDIEIDFSSIVFDPESMLIAAAHGVENNDGSKNWVKECDLATGRFNFAIIFETLTSFAEKYAKFDSGDEMAGYDFINAGPGMILNECLDIQIQELSTYTPEINKKEQDLVKLLADIWKRATIES